METVEYIGIAIAVVIAFFFTVIALEEWHYSEICAAHNGVYRPVEAPRNMIICKVVQPDGTMVEKAFEKG